MDPVDSGNSSAAATGKRPSLFAQSQPASNESKPAEPISILSSLDKNAGKKSIRSSTGLPTWFTIAIGSLLGITIAAALVISLARESGLRPPPDQPVVVAHTEVPVKAPEAPAAPNPPNNEVNAGATIENAPPAAIAPTSTVPTDSPQPTPVANTTTQPATEATASAKAAPVVAATASAPPAPTKTAETVSVQENRPAGSALAEMKAERPSPGRKATPAHKDTRPSKPPTGPADRDASLLAALVAYGEGKPAAEINANAAAIEKPSANSKTATGQTTLAQSGQFDPKRDVVLRSPNVSTTELVRRCRTLGFVEGLLCRNRVCANLWGKDAACPQAAAPAANRGTE